MAFIKGWSPSELTSCEGDFAYLVWQSSKKRLIKFFGSKSFARLWKPVAILRNFGGKKQIMFHTTWEIRAVYSVGLLFVEDGKEFTDLHSIHIKSIYSLKGSLSHTNRTGKTKKINWAVTTSYTCTLYYYNKFSISKNIIVTYVLLTSVNVFHQVLHSL